MLLFASSALAGSVAMQLAAPEVVAGQSVDLYVQVTDASLARPPTIRVPEGLRVEFDSRGISREMINFQTREVATYRYTVTALTAGEYDIGPLEVGKPGSSLLAPAVHLKVGERGTATGTDELVATLGLEEAWLGQVVVHHMKVATSRRVVSARWGPPENSLLTPEPGIEPVTAEYRLGQGADPLTVEELWYAMRASKVGRTSVTGGSLLAQYAVRRKRGRNDFFNDLPMFADVENDTLVANPLPLVVRALPTEGRPADFSGLVGSFTLQAEPSRTTVQVGDTVTVDVTLQGNGAVAGFTLPAWEGEGFRVYDDTPVLEVKLADGAVSGHARFKRAVVPSVAGPLTLPPIDVNWFDPATGRYETAKLAPITLDVGGSAAAATMESFGPAGEPQRVAVATEAEDILPVRTNVSLSAPRSGAWAWLACLPGLAWLAAQAAPAFARVRRPVAAAAFGFGDLPDEAEGRLAGLERIFREEAARRLRRPEPGLKREDVAALGEEAVALYRELDQARYRGAGELPEARVRAWVERRP
jgi:hypothetical protein